MEPCGSSPMSNLITLARVAAASVGWLDDSTSPRQTTRGLARHSPFLAGLMIELAQADSAGDEIVNAKLWRAWQWSAVTSMDRIQATVEDHRAS